MAALQWQPYNGSHSFGGEGGGQNNGCLLSGLELEGVGSKVAGTSTRGRTHKNTHVQN